MGFVRKGMSEMMAIVIGVVLTVALGAALWPLITSMINNQSNNAKMLVSISASYIGDHKVSIVINVKNIGSVNLENVVIDKVLVNGKSKPILVGGKLITSSLNVSASASKEIIVNGDIGDPIVVVVSAEANGNPIYAQAKTIVNS